METDRCKEESIGVFTGIIEATALVLAKEGPLLTIERPVAWDDLCIGGSICVNGVCLSIKNLNKKCIQFDVIPETAMRSTLGSCGAGDTVNLERAMKASDRLDGHIVQGHVEGVGEVRSIAFSVPQLFPFDSSSIPRPLPPEEEGGRRKAPMGSTMLFFSRALRKRMTDAEKILWNALRHDQLGVRFRRQFVIETRILDFYCPPARFCIEIDGSVHGVQSQKNEDVVRDQYLFQEHGVHTLRFTNEEVLSDCKSVLQTIQKFLKNIPPPPSEEGEGVEVVITVPSALFRNIVPKGSIAIDGVSLTVASIEENVLTVALIPHTLENTTLGRLKKGDRVNIETDILARYAGRG